MGNNDSFNRAVRMMSVDANDSDATAGLKDSADKELPYSFTGTDGVRYIVNDTKIQFGEVMFYVISEKTTKGNWITKTSVEMLEHGVSGKKLSDVMSGGQ